MERTINKAELETLLGIPIDDWQVLVLVSLLKVYDRAEQPASLRGLLDEHERQKSERRARGGHRMDTDITIDPNAVGGDSRDSEATVTEQATEIAEWARRNRNQHDIITEWSGKIAAQENVIATLTAQLAEYKMICQIIRRQLDDL